jgi:hypothetical protein
MFKNGKEFISFNNEKINKIEQYKDKSITIFLTSSATMSHNVPVVNDGLATRIRACVARPWLPNCAGVRRGNGA